MLGVPSFKSIPCKSSITVNGAHVMPGDGGPINYSFCGTLSRDWTIRFLSRQAVVLFTALVLFAEHLHVLIVDDRLHVGHAPVANFHCVSVEDFAKGVVGWKVIYSSSLCPSW